MEISIELTAMIAIATCIMGFLLRKPEIVKLEKDYIDLADKHLALKEENKKDNTELSELQISYRAATELQERTQANLDNQNELYRRELALAEQRKFTKVDNTGPDKVDGTDDWYLKTTQGGIVGSVELDMLFTEEAVGVAIERAKKYPHLIAKPNAVPAKP